MFKLRLFVSICTIITAMLFTLPVGGSSTLSQDKPPQVPIDTTKIIAAFTAQEVEFRQALSMYKFKRDVILQTIGAGGQPSGEYRRVSNIVFKDDGTQDEKITFFPQPSLVGLVVTQKDLDDLQGIQPFALETAQIPKYNIVYAGKEHITYTVEYNEEKFTYDLDAYMFDVAPKVMPNPKKTEERFFVGRVWVDAEGLQIVATNGRAVPETKDHKYPEFETFRHKVDNKYWFPVRTSADTVLEFENSNVHMTMTVIYDDYKKHVGKLVVIDEIDAPVETPTPKP